VQYCSGFCFSRDRNSMDYNWQIKKNQSLKGRKRNKTMEFKGRRKRKKKKKRNKRKTSRQRHHMDKHSPHIAFNGRCHLDASICPKKNCVQRLEDTTRAVIMRRVLLHAGDCFICSSFFLLWFLLYKNLSIKS